MRDTIRHGGGVAERGESEGGGREHGTKRQVGWITWKGRELT